MSDNETLLEHAKTIERLTAERDRAREECGFEKGMRRSQRKEMENWIRRVSAARDALVETGRWSIEDVGWDIAARIRELATAGTELTRVTAPCAECAKGAQS